MSSEATARREAIAAWNGDSSDLGAVKRRTVTVEQISMWHERDLGCEAESFHDHLPAGRCPELNSAGVARARRPIVTDGSRALRQETRPGVSHPRV